MEYHLLTCMNSGLRASAHTIIKRGLMHLMGRAGMSAANEPVLAHSSIRADLGTRHGGKHLVVDVALTHALSKEHRSLRLRKGGLAADNYARLHKDPTYRFITTGPNHAAYDVHIFVLEMLGSQGLGVQRLSRTIASRIAAREGLSLASAMHGVNSRIAILTQQAACHCLKASTQVGDGEHFQSSSAPHMSMNPQHDTALEAYERRWAAGGGMWTEAMSESGGFSDVSNRSSPLASSETTASEVQLAEAPSTPSLRPAGGAQSDTQAESDPAPSTPLPHSNNTNRHGAKTSESTTAPASTPSPPSSQENRSGSGALDACSQATLDVRGTQSPSQEPLSPRATHSTAVPDSRTTPPPTSISTNAETNLQTPISAQRSPPLPHNSAHPSNDSLCHGSVPSLTSLHIATPSYTPQRNNRCPHLRH